MSTTFSLEEIKEAKRKLLDNVLEVREGDTWVKYGSAAALRNAIAMAEKEHASLGRPSGSRKIQFDSGY